MLGKQSIVFKLPCPYCGRHEFTICHSILTGQIPVEIAHLIFQNVLCRHCRATFAKTMMIDPVRHAQQQNLDMSVNSIPVNELSGLPDKVAARL